MTYGDPFTHEATESTPANVVTNPNAIYTIVTEAEDELGRPPFDADSRYIDYRYDTIQHLPAFRVAAYANSLAEDDREVAIFQGRLSTPANFTRHIPVGYVYPGGVWRKTNR
jgi:hypothetical protein